MVCPFVFVHIGQCGVQIGSELWNSILDNNPLKHIPGLTDAVSHSLPCILSDTEPKAVETFNKRIRKVGVHPLNVITKKKGCGNNWSCGYNDDLSESIMHRIRQLSEQCDIFLGIVIFHSMAGGTGSGVTCKLIEMLRVVYPNRYIINVSITPFIGGESPLQYYNTLLTLSWLQEFSDGIIIIHNDDIIKQNDTITSMNRTISLLLSNCLKPIEQRSLYRVPCEIVQTVCPLSDCKFIKTSIVFNNWDIKLTNKSRGISQNILCILRGDKSSIKQLMTNIKPIEKKLITLYNPVKWNPFPIDYWFGPSTTRHASVLVNSYNITEYLNIVYNKAVVMFDQRAYLHWYNKHGLEDNSFTQSFDCIRQIIDNYTVID